ncbi:MAG: SDR family oxidoreductase [Roseimicrobium sp.]
MVTTTSHTSAAGMLDLTGRVALITGSSRGIGRACAVRLAEAGADVVVNYVTSRTAAQEVAEEVQQLGRRAVVVKADVSEQEDVQAMADFIKETFGALDIVVSNAASGGFRQLVDANARHFEATMNTNVRALLWLVQATLPLLARTQGRSKVIALSSQGSHRAQPLYGLVGASKAALASMVRHFALEIGGRGVNLNIVEAGLVQTDSFRLMPHGSLLAERVRERSMVGGQLVTERDVADAVLFLASPLSDMVQGHTLVVDGGCSMLG